jgi:CRP/FNR family cyclic AMP-dependent transcriptional regulator
MIEKKSSRFDVAGYLDSEGTARRRMRLRKKQSFFTQGDAADAVYYIQTGRAKLTVVSKKGKEATVSLLGPGDFTGEEALAVDGTKRTATATALVACSLLRIGRDEMLRTMHDEHDLSAFFLRFMLLRAIRTQADLVDQLFNSSERRLARILLLMADFGKPGEPVTEIPSITQETLAEMIGTTRSRVNFFMNRFRKLGYVEYNGHLHVNRSLLNVVLLDQLPEQNASRPVLLDPVPSKKPAKKPSRPV